MRKTVPKLSRELPEGPSDLETLIPQTIHPPLNAPPFLISAPLSSLRGGLLQILYNKTWGARPQGRPLETDCVPQDETKTRQVSQWEVGFNRCSWRRCVPPVGRKDQLSMSAGRSCVQERESSVDGRLYFLLKRRRRRKKFCAQLLRPLMTQNNNTGSYSGVLENKTKQKYSAMKSAQ